MKKYQKLFELPYDMEAYEAKLKAWYDKYFEELKRREHGQPGEEDKDNDESRHEVGTKP